MCHMKQQLISAIRFLLLVSAIVCPLCRIPLLAAARVAVQNTNAGGIEGLFHAHLPRFNLRVCAATKLRETNRVPRIIQRLRAPAITDDLPAIMAS